MRIGTRSHVRSMQILATLLILIFLVLSSSQSANALPAFARKYGMRCSACHESWSMLNYFGQKFKDNGYQLMNDRDSPMWQNPAYWPVTFRITPIWHRVSTGIAAGGKIPAYVEKTEAPKSQSGSQGAGGGN